MYQDQAAELSAIALGLTFCMGLLLIILPRRVCMIPIVMTTCYMTLGQIVDVGGLHFTMLRLLVLAGCIRIILRREFKSIQWLRLDTVMLWWIISGTLAYSLLWHSWDAVINRLGVAYDAWGLYFIFRAIIRDVDDVVRTCKFFAYLLVPVAAAMTAERLTGRNLFFALGGVPEYTEIRDGVLRCQGPFRHPILAGTFGATWIPMFLGLWWLKKGRRLAAVCGIVSATVITGLSGSSGPLAAYMAGLLACAAWRLRGKLRLIRWSLVAGITLLALVMKDPVWFIFARVNIFAASTGWHRANLIDQTIRHFFDWWLVGVQNVEAWGVWWGDVTNQFILEGIRGGLVTALLFLYIVILAFSMVGQTLADIKDEPRRYQMLVWALGCTIFAHTVAFQDVAYFDQNAVNWYWALAAVAASTIVYSGEKNSSSCREPAPVHDNDIDPNITGALPSYLG
jgi:hypothetical protein